MNPGCRRIFGVLVATCAACTSEAPGTVDGGEEVVSRAELVAVRVMTIVGAEDLSVTDISAVSLDPEDSTRLAVLDRSRRRVVIVDLDEQSVVASTGPTVQRPTEVEFREGQLLVSEVEPVVHVVDRGDLGILDTIELQQSIFAKRLHPTRRGFIAEGTDTHNPSASLFEHTMDGELLRSWHGFSTSDVAPFWGAFFWEHAAVSEAGDVFVASAMRYPLVHYDPDGARRTFGTPPPSYRPPRRPERFEFSGVGEARVRYEEFARSFTTISSVWVADDQLVVEHKDLDPEEMSFRSPSFSLDIYDLSGLEKVATSLPSPGPIVDSDGGRLLILTAQPPTDDWTVTEYRVSVEGSGR